MSMGLCLVTRGMLCVPRSAEVIPLISCAEPLVISALEARPRVRLVNTPPNVFSAPKVVSAKEQKPVTEGGTVVDYRPVIEEI